MSLLTDPPQDTPRPRAALDSQLILLTAIATLLGLLAIFDAGFARSVLKGEGVVPREARTQFVYALVAVGGGLLCALPTAAWWRRFAPWAFGAALVGLVAVKLVGAEMNGAQRWIDLGPFNVQPAEFAKLGAILFFAWALAGRRAWTGPRRDPRGIGEWLDLVAVPKFLRAVPLFVVLVAVVMVEREPDLGTAAVIAATAVVMLVVGGVTWKSLAILGVVGSVGVTAMVIQEPYRVDRITSHVHRWEPQHRDDVGYQTTQSEMAMASGGVLGVMPGAGRAKHMLPAATTDFVMATVAEEFGLIGALAVLGVLGLLVRRLLVLGSRVEAPFARLALYGVAAWIGLQTCVNVMMANGALPAIGIPLPFFSSGGSSLVALWAAIGFCLAVSRSTPKRQAGAA